MALIYLFLDISLFRRGPQDCPASWLLLGLAVSANFLVGTLLSLTGSEGLAALGQALLGIGLLAAFLLGALYFTDKLPRLLKTGTAAFGTDTLISLVALVFILLGELIPDLKEIVGMVLLLLMFWQIAVLGHILRHALAIPLLAGVGLSFVYFLVSYRILMTLFPVGDY